LRLVNGNTKNCIELFVSMRCPEYAVTH
jgi:hypothetical protein